VVVIRSEISFVMKARLRLTLAVWCRATRDFSAAASCCCYHHKY